MSARAEIDAWRKVVRIDGRISFAMTLDACRERRKIETRRNGWAHAHAGLHLLAVDRVMGFRKGERVDDVVELLGVVRVLEARREPLNAITVEGCTHEGLPDLTPERFVERYCKAMRHMPKLDVTVLRFAWLCAGKCGAITSWARAYCDACIDLGARQMHAAGVRP